MTEPAELYKQALEACNRRDWQAALALASQFLRNSRPHAGMHYVAGVASLELGLIPQAVNHLRHAVALDPQRANFATLYAKALSSAGVPALGAADHALSLSPTDPSLLITLGMIYSQALAHDRAASLFRQVIAIVPSHAVCHYFLAVSLIFLGDIDAAEQALENCLMADSTFWKAYLSRSLLRRQTSVSQHVEQLDLLLTRPDVKKTEAALICLHMALAKEHEDLENYDRAFAHLVSGKSTGRRHRNYDIRRDEELFKTIADTFTVALTDASGCTTEEPIFVIGMPRSGTTLVDRIISSHPDVYSAGELQNFPVAFKRACGSLTPQLLDANTILRANVINWEHLGASYLASTRPATGHTRRFIDKLPHNFIYVGAIARALPNAKIICLKRDPMDICLSNFRQLFGETSQYHDYSYDLLDIGRYYVLFDHLMSHWKQTLPGRILEVQYEAVVDAQQSSTRQLLEYCGLPWNDNCLDFQKNPEPVTTASTLQVRQPIYRSAVKRWKRYENHLIELSDLLKQHGVVLTP